jgi:ribosomal protein S18 acetylase RimI-like enzyme
MQADFDPSQLVVRRATARDAPAIGAVFDAAVRAGWGYLGELAQQPMFTPKDWDQLVADHAPPNVLLVATDQAGTVLGYTAAHPDDGELFLLFVDPAYAGQGVGRTLLGAAHDALRDAGCQQAFLFTHEHNDQALAIYARAGYRPDGTTRESDMRGTPIRELRLVKQL